MLLLQVVRMLCAGVVHGDLSEFNILLGSDGPVIIDLPQAVDAAGNNHAQRMLLRLALTSFNRAIRALGAPRWKVITSVTVRSARAGIMTGILLAVARISGETAPLLFTSLNNQFWSLDMNKPMSNLPVVIFQFAMSPYENWQQIAWAGALLITLSVLLLNIFARVFFRNTTPSQ